ncbi:WD40 repeat domain-containing protein, partial [Streptomyces sp. NPDC058441]|uniref:WD40 repeat domain-containing protein n=1 Tax=Streptomyces sp. NPDC058441 TaxID=3346502 RepID=UPI00364CA349
TVRIWDLATGHQLGEPLTGHTRAVNAVATAEVNGRPVAVTGSEDHTVRIWDLATGHQLGEPLTGHTRAVNAVATAEVDGRPVAVTGSEDHTVQIWDLATASCLAILQLPDSPSYATLTPEATAVLGIGHEVIALDLTPIFRRRS